MQSFKSFLFEWYLRWQKLTAKKPDLLTKRANMDEAGARGFTKDVTSERIALRGIPGLLLRPAQADEKRIVCYFHGGGYVSGSMHSHMSLGAHLAKEAKAMVVLPDYNLAPEAPFPAAVNDAVASLEWLYLRYPEAKLVVAGDSAGGGLSLAAMLKLREEQLRMPDLAVLIAPWADLTCPQEEMGKVGWRDPVLTRKGLMESARMYHLATSPQNPFVSPLFADNFEGFPPTLLQVGTHDILLGDSQRLCKKMQASGLEVQLDVWPQMVHVWHMQLCRIPEAMQAVQKIGRFIQANA